MKIPFLLSICLCVAPFRVEAQEKISFNRDIRPILSDKCFYCHGPDKNTREAKMRLDIRDAAIEKHAIAPGDLKGSEVFWRIHSEDPDEIMPTPESNKSLSAEEKGLLDRWIEEGAEYEEHWAWLSVVKPAAGGNAGSDAIDYFVDQRLADEGLERASEAEAVTLARRLSFDLIGLPPTEEDLAFFNAKGIEVFVDRLLASPHYGERMTIDWLDAVRYADSVGYHGDQLRQASPFRDWVIDAFNENKRFDEFTIEQIAGDLLPNATVAQRVASSYNRLNQVSAEGGIQDGEYLAKYQSERVRTTSTAWLGTTLACAECHDHKFDPFSAKDFYQFAAFFADILEKGAWNGDGAYQEDTARYLTDDVKIGGYGPELLVPTESQRDRVAEIVSEVEVHEAVLAQSTPELIDGAKAWAEEQREALTSDEAVDFVYLDEKGEKHGAKFSATFVDSTNGQVRSGKVARSQKAEGLTQHTVDARNEPLEIGDDTIFYAYVWLDPETPPKAVMLQFNDGEGWNHRGVWGDDSISYGRSNKSTPAYFRRGGLPPRGQWARIEVSAAEVGLEPGMRVEQFAFTQFGGQVYWDDSGVTTASKRYKLGQLPPGVKSALSKSESELSAAETAAVLEHFRTFAPHLAETRDLIAALKNEHDTIEAATARTPVTISAEARTIRVLNRGDWMDKNGEIVEPGAPHFLPQIDGGEEPLTRLDLAEWIVSRDNPLTARTFVNRLWSRYFGNGLSNVLNDLGSQGEWPTHPELLDWLAAEFMESGWDLKHLVKTIVLSDTYRQSSQSTPELEERDPNNRLFARQSRIRLPAELIRDNVLAVSGLLNPEIGGQSARPYQPEGYYQHLNFPRREYAPHENANQYRRGVYTHWQRTFLHPSMQAFDAPPREECTMERKLSNTPLQALVLLNDPSYVEAARVLASECKDIDTAFQRVLNRLPTDEERLILEEVLASEKARLDAESTKAISQIGLAEPTPDEAVPMTAVTRVLLNLHESITRY